MPIHNRSKRRSEGRNAIITPANQVVVFHVAVLAQINAHYFAPEQQALNQHPAERCQEEQMHQSCHKRAGHLWGRGQRAGSQGSKGQTSTQTWRYASLRNAKYGNNTKVVLRHCQTAGTIL